MPSIRRPKRVASTPNASRANQQRQAAAPRRGLRSRATRGEASGPVSVLGHPTSAAPVVPTPTQVANVPTPTCANAGLTQVPWATVHWELWLCSQNSSPRRLSNVPANRFVKTSDFVCTKHYYFQTYMY